MDGRATRVTCGLVVAVLALSGLRSLAEPRLISHEPAVSCAVTVSAYFYAGQTVPGSARAVADTGWQNLPVSADASHLLIDGKTDWPSAVKTHFWGDQRKRIRVLLDLGRTCRLDRVEAWAAGGTQPGNFIATVDLDYGLTLADGEPWDGHARVGNPYPDDKADPEEYPLVVRHLEKPARYLSLVCESSSAMMALGEVRVYGEPVDPPLPVTIPEGTLRFEAEQIPGAVPLENGNLLGNRGAWVSTVGHEAELPLPPDRTFCVWIRYFDNGQRTLQVTVNGKVERLPEQPAKKLWSFHHLATPVQGRIKIGLRGVGGQPPGVDALLFCPTAEFDPNTVTQLDAFMRLPAVERDKGPAERLWDERGATLGVADWAAEVRRLYAYPPAKRDQPVVDDYGNPLRDGKPWFQLAFFHCGVREARLRDVAVNTFMDAAPDWNAFAARDSACVLSYHSQWRAYDAIARQLKESGLHPRLALHYICDEPENVLVSVPELQRLNALIQALSPHAPTFINVSPNQAGNAGVLSIPDVVGLDQYPIPGGRLADIGANLDMMRLSSGGKPVIFVAQTFSWEAYGRPGSRWPTPAEVRAMVLLALVHQARGLWFYEFPAPTMGSPTCIADIQPELWVDLKQFLRQLQELIPALTGPETELPCRVVTTGKMPVEVRLALSADRAQAVLLVVNPWPEAKRAELDFNGGPLPDAALAPRFTTPDVACRPLPEARHELTLPAYGSGVLDLASTQLRELRTLTRDQALTAIRQRLSNRADRPTAGVPLVRGTVQGLAETAWAQGCDLLDTWQSSNRPDAARILATEAGLHLQVITRFPKGARSTHLKRDSEVWADPSVELFVGNPATSRYVQLVVNTANTQLDTAADPSRPDPMDLARDFTWESRVTTGEELAEYHLRIPWASLREMTGLGPGDAILFNLASGSSRWDWSGLTGGGYHQPWRFGQLRLPAATSNP